MHNREADSFTHYLKDISKEITDDDVEWIAISVKYKDGITTALHSAGAPKRPQGIKF